MSTPEPPLDPPNYWDDRPTEREIPDTLEDPNAHDVREDDFIMTEYEKLVNKNY